MRQGHADDDVDDGFAGLGEGGEAEGVVGSGEGEDGAVALLRGVERGGISWVGGVDGFAGKILCGL